jgi:hypothetical protein
MRFDEIIAEGISDSIRSSMYRNLGIGGTEAGEIAAKQNFIDRFKQQIKLNQQSGKAAGGFGTDDLQQMVDSYLSQYGWVANEKDRLAISKYIETNNIDALSNQMYLVGSKQFRDPKTGSVINPAKTQDKGQPVLNNVATGIITQLKKLSGEESLDDLEQITKHAMQRLYKLNPSSYQQLYKEITSGSGSNFKMPEKNSPEYFDAKRQLATQKARATMVPK